MQDGVGDAQEEAEVVGLADGDRGEGVPGVQGARAGKECGEEAGRQGEPAGAALARRRSRRARGHGGGGALRAREEEGKGCGWRKKKKKKK